ncbi:MULTISPECIES: integrase [Pseudoalteromonas]|uniref:Integrase n=1 Tax=Pseudoalteromonas amylolytica TaxID=1859457 RepID=A0A1S1MVI9_9GAMM|nr:MULTISPECIES: integrase [Pseudoalteromonas]OHU86487.1 integrase [Pseudoalteromonas sp. JW3]OHU88988.1 integrase [Pseudoalteromonas amylolytica]
MPKFAKADTQAKNVIKGLTKAQRIKSLGTARNYMQSLKTVANWSKDIGINGIQAMSIEQARIYLEYRAEIVGQKALDMERQAIQAMMQLNGKLQPKETLYRVKSCLEEIKRSRAYTKDQARAISHRQTAKHQLATQIAYAAGLRAHELLTLAKARERSADKRPALDSKWHGRSGELYTVQGKGGLIRHVLIPTTLANKLEQQRLAQPITVVDRKINYLQRYDIAGGKKWSDSFSKASNRALLFSTGAHGLRHSYAQERMVELKSLGYKYETALETVSQEMGHFRAEITLVYLR